MPDDLLMTQLELKKAQKMRQAQQNELLDVCEIVALPAGPRFLAGVCRDLGLGQSMQGANDYARYNEGLRLIKKIGKASPNAAREILCQCFGV